jgi:hypothetical protein
MFWKRKKKGERTEDNSVRVFAAEAENNKARGNFERSRKNLEDLMRTLKAGHEVHREHSHKC